MEDLYNRCLRLVGEAGSLASSPVVLNDDGGWCWFQDDRCLVQNGRLIFGSVAAGRFDPSRRGAIEVTGVDLETGAITRAKLDTTPVGPAGTYDDHNAPAFAVRSDGKLLAAWTGHAFDDRILHRISTAPGDPSRWDEERVFVPSPPSKVTYSNLHRLADEHERIYDFFRGERSKPRVAYSDDQGVTWDSGGLVIDMQGKGSTAHRPYVKYASNGKDIVHFVYTEGHPRDFNNGLYHAYYRAGQLHRSDGSSIGSFSEGLRDPTDGTCIFAGDANNVAWAADLQLDRDGHPLVAYSVQKDSAALKRGEGGQDHRYRLARWSGTEWRDAEVSFAGTSLYPSEEDYTGGIAIVPGDPPALFISTNVDPSTGAPLRSLADDKQHWEIFRGTPQSGDLAWRWEHVTRDSDTDNIRPVVARDGGLRPILLWLRGTYRSFVDYDLEVVGCRAPR